MDDYDLIEASFLSQYGIRLKTVELQFDEFLNLVSCLMSDTPLGQIVAIRSETDPEAIRGFNKAQRRIYNEWKYRDRDTSAQKVNSEQEYRANMDALFAMIRA